MFFILNIISWKNMDKINSTRAINKSNQKPLYKVQLIIIPQTPLFCKEFNYRINDGQTTLSITKVFLNCDKTITDTFNLFVFFFIAK